MGNLPPSLWGVGLRGFKLSLEQKQPKHRREEERRERKEKKRDLKTFSTKPKVMNWAESTNCCIPLGKSPLRKKTSNPLAINEILLFFCTRQQKTSTWKKKKKVEWMKFCFIRSFLGNLNYNLDLPRIFLKAMPIQIPANSLIFAKILFPPNRGLEIFWGPIST